MAQYVLTASESLSKLFLHQFNTHDLSLEIPEPCFELKFNLHN